MCLASPHRPKVSRSEYQMSCELRIDAYLVLRGWFSQMKKRWLPSAEIVGLSSGNSEFIFQPRFSILMMVPSLIIFSFWAISFSSVSFGGLTVVLTVAAVVVAVVCERAGILAVRIIAAIKKGMTFFMGLDLMVK